MDNNLDKIFTQVKELEEQAKIEEARIEQLEKQKQEMKAAQAQQKKESQKQHHHHHHHHHKEKKPEKAQPQIVEPPKFIEDKASDWSQEQQMFLEKSIIEFKDVKDPKEKWQKIAENVPNKNMKECIARFKECKQKAEEV